MGRPALLRKSCPLASTEAAGQGAIEEVGSHRQRSLTWDIYFQVHSDGISGFLRAVQQCDMQVGELFCGKR